MSRHTALLLLWTTLALAGPAIAAPADEPAAEPPAVVEDGEADPGSSLNGEA